MVLKITNLHILRYLPTCWLYLLERYAIDNQRCTHTASVRIRKAFEDYQVKTSFIAAAIEKKMATEIYNQLSEGILSNAANLTVDKQLTAYCDWLIKL